MAATTVSRPELYEAARRVGEADDELIIALRKWLGRMQNELLELSGALNRHVAEVEGPQGLFAQVTADEPRLVPHADKLRRRHDELRGLLERTLLDVADPEMVTDPDKVRDVNVAVHEAMHSLDRYQHQAYEISYAAYKVELGGPVG